MTACIAGHPPQQLQIVAGFDLLTDSPNKATWLERLRQQRWAVAGFCLVVDELDPALAFVADTIPGLILLSLLRLRVDAPLMQRSVIPLLAFLD